MSNLIRWDPFRELSNFRWWNFRNEMDRMFENNMLSPFETTTWDLALDVAETDDEFLVKASLPGINPDELEITYNANVLTIKGETREEKETDEKRYHLRERRYGSFSRSVSLPSSVKPEKIEASYDAGVLTLHLPKAEEAKPKRIPVTAGSTPKVIEGKVRETTSKK
jgi:HSP20 family protein